MNDTITTFDATNESHWLPFLHEFRCRTDTVYLNHGSFGLALNCVRHQRDLIVRQMEIQPMDFYVRQLEPMLIAARQRLAEFVGTTATNIAFVDNATYAMNVVANSMSLEPGDEVLLTDQTYGAVRRIWEKVTAAAGAKIVEVKLPEKIESKQQVIDSIVGGVTAKTKIAIFSHIVSVSALILPVREICDVLRKRKVMTCVDGPHALVQVDLKLNQLGCDFYTASCHKWLCGPLGTGFVFAKEVHRDKIVAPITGWGRLDPQIPGNWDEEQFWLGTRNVAGFLAIPTAIEYFEKFGVQRVRARMNHLAETAEAMLTDLFGTEPIANRVDGWYGSMAHVPLPAGDWSQLQHDLWAQAGIEVPVWQLNNRWWIRVSCHLYNTRKQLEYLVSELKIRL